MKIGSRIRCSIFGVSEPCGYACAPSPPGLSLLDLENSRRPRLTELVLTVSFCHGVRCELSAAHKFTPNPRTPATGKAQTYFGLFWGRRPGTRRSIRAHDSCLHVDSSFSKKIHTGSFTYVYGSASPAQSTVVVLGNRCGGDTLGLGTRLRRGFTPRGDIDCVAHGTL